jgi:hypothetical protein
MGSTYQSIVLDAEPDKVWDTVKNFHDLGWAPNVITSCEKVGDTDQASAGAKRVLNGAIHETLIEFNNEKRFLRYQITDGPSPISKEEVKNYFGTLRVVPVTEGKGTFLEWHSEWEQNDAPVYEFCHGVYCALLGELKGKFTSIPA